MKVFCTELGRLPKKVRSLKRIGKIKVKKNISKIFLMSKELLSWALKRDYCIIKGPDFESPIISENDAFHLFSLHLKSFLNYLLN